MDVLEEHEVLEDDLDVLEVVQGGMPRRIWNRSDHFQEMDNLTFFKRFRLTKPTVLYVLEQIYEQLEYPSDRNNSVTPMNQLLTCLRLYATGGHLSSIADFIGMDTSTASRIVEKVSPIIANLRPQYVYMPVGQESIEVQNNFFKMHSFPRVEGVIDGTHIRMQSPGGEDPLVFINRKGYYSLNVQLVGDPDLKIRDIVARWPGSAHDQTIFNNSRIRARCEENEFPNTVLLEIPEPIYLLAIPFNDSYIYFTQCKPTWTQETDTIFFVVKSALFYVAPLLLMSVAYIKIIRVLWRSGNAPHQHIISQGSAKSAEGQAVNSFAMNMNASTEGQLKSRRKTAKMLVAVVIMFAICFLPVHLLSILRLTISMKNSDMNQAFSLISHWLCYANSAVNPVIYNFMSGKFRQEFKSAFIKCRQKENPDLNFTRTSTYIYRYTTGNNHRNSARSKTETIPLSSIK